jgi:hypothetical protein
MKKPYYLYSVGGFQHGPFTYDDAVKHAKYQNDQRWEGDLKVYIIDREVSFWEMITGNIIEAKKP